MLLGADWAVIVLVCLLLLMNMLSAVDQEE